VPDADQFNSLHEKLIASFRALAVTCPVGTPVHFTCSGDSEEDRGNIDYLRDVAMQGGVDARFVAIEDIGWDRTAGAFVVVQVVVYFVVSRLVPGFTAASEAGKVAPASLLAAVSVGTGLLNAAALICRARVFRNIHMIEKQNSNRLQWLAITQKKERRDGSQAP
jgi:glutathionylspermidine synthase